MRPPPPVSSNTGYHYEAREEVGDYLRWLCLSPDESGRCRMMNPSKGWRCPNAAVAKLYRQGRRRSGWWYYCAEHVYGRWIEDGKVMHWVLVPDTPDAGTE